MINNSISIRNVSKCYKIYDSRNARLKEWLLPFSGSHHREKWVLRDINLEVRPGEAIGIIGLNGAGKSTLLKIITGTTVPTTGEVHFDGTVAALLELGLGFHPDFTGRQNVYMSGQLLGYTVEEINACMEEMEAFAEIGQAVDAPVRTYSSGMQVRLAFSVATMKRPDILIVDEALSVGDAYFQHKSFNRIKEFCQQGTTLLLVSHDISAVQAVCDRAVLLDHGRILRQGSPSDIIDYYNALIGGIDDTPIKQERTEEGRAQTFFGNQKAKILEYAMRNLQGKEFSVADVGEKVTIEVLCEAQEDLESINCGIMIKNRLGESVYGTNTGLMKKDAEQVKKGEKVRFVFSTELNIGEGNYSLSIAIHSGEDHLMSCYEWRDLACVFEVVNQGHTRFAGIAYLDTRVDVERIG